MRKLLLASVAGLGAWGAVATEASAQTAPVSSSANYTTYSGGMANPTAAAPTPGTVVVRLNGRFRFFAAAIFDKDVENNAAGTGFSGTVNPVTGLGTATGGNKLATYGFGEYARLYPGFDGVAANGLKYGASLEIRQDNNSGAGGGTFGSISVQNRARSSLYLRREWGYIGTNEIGIFRLGATDQPTSLFLTGNFENFNDGGWNGDVPGLVAAPAAPLWPFSDTGSYYTTNKIVYLSPQLFGFDLGASYEPSTANVNVGSGCGAGSFAGTNFINPAGTFVPAAGANSTGAASPGCDRLSSSPINAESARRRNTFDVVLRYRGTFGPAGIAATAGYIGGGHVLDNSTGVAFNNNPLVGPIRRDYQGLNIGDFGLAATFAGFTVGGHYTFGRFNGNVANLVPSGFSDTRAYVVGASYTLGPIIAGVQYFVNENPGDLGNAFFGRQRREQGLAAGGTYALAPGVSIFLSYLWGQRKQNGFDLVTGQGVSAAAPNGVPFNNKVTSQVFAVGTGFSW